MGFSWDELLLMDSVLRDPHFLNSGHADINGHPLSLQALAKWPTLLDLGKHPEGPLA